MNGRPRRLGLWIPWAAFAILAIAWCLYWAAIAQGARQGLDRLVAAQAAAGAELRIGAVRTRGFPLQLALEMRDLSYASRGRFLQVSTAEATAHVNPLNLGHVIVAFPAPIDFTRGDVPHRLSARVLQASVQLRARDRRFTQAGLAAHDLRMVDTEDGGLDFAADRLVLSARPDPRNARELQAALIIEGATLKEPVQGFLPLGREIAELNGAIVIEQAEALSLRGDPLYAWREAGGALRIEGLSLVWGPAQVRGTGRVGLDVMRRLSGALELDAEEPGALLQALLREHPAVARLAPAPPRSLSLRAQDGALLLEDIVLRELAPLYRAPTP